MLPKWVKTTKSRFIEIQSMVTEGKNNKLETKIVGKILRLNNAEKFLKEIASTKSNRNEAIKIYKDVMSEANLMIGLNKTKKEWNCETFLVSWVKFSQSLEQMVKQMKQMIKQMKQMVKQMITRHYRYVWFREWRICQTKRIRTYNTNSRSKA